MVWDQLEPTPAHLTYLLLSTFLISYVLFVRFFRNRLHLSEPPIALLVGVLLGPYLLNWVTPSICKNGECTSDPSDGGWGWGDNVVQEITRVIVGIQCFAVGVELPPHYASRKWFSVGMMLGPIMAFGWVICTVFIWAIFHTSIASASVIAATLTPTDPVLASSILSNSQFSTRIPRRIKHLLSAESGCNDGVSFPFLYIGLYILTKSSAGEVAKNWFLITLLWQCTVGLLIGVVIGWCANRILRFSNDRRYIDPAGLILFWLLMAMLCVGVGSTLGVDDFLVAFGAGYGFARDGWFTEKIKAAELPKITDMFLNSAMFLYLGAIMPFDAFRLQEVTPWVTTGRLFALLALVLLFRRIPIVLALYQWIPDIKSFREALFCGHFGPMGLGALFLAMEARGILENDKPIPDDHPPNYEQPYSDREQTIKIIYPIVCFIVLGSTLVHGLSVLALSLASHFSRPKEHRAGITAAETDPLLEGHHASDASRVDDSESDQYSQIGDEDNAA